MVYVIILDGVVFSSCNNCGEFCDECIDVWELLFFSISAWSFIVLDFILEGYVTSLGSGYINSLVSAYVTLSISGYVTSLGLL